MHRRSLVATSQALAMVSTGAAAALAQSASAADAGSHVDPAAARTWCTDKGGTVQTRTAT
jgi:hypothetical protein